MFFLIHFLIHLYQKNFCTFFLLLVTGIDGFSKPGCCMLHSLEQIRIELFVFRSASACCRWQRSSHNREFHNVNCRFSGAIHNVDWACISVLSQVIRNVNERKTVQTNMISFVSHGAGILTIMEASAEHDCCSEAQRNAWRTGTSYFVCTVFLFINL